jgi:hypothetical protein
MKQSRAPRRVSHQSLSALSLMLIGRGSSSSTVTGAGGNAAATDGTTGTAGPTGTVGTTVRVRVAAGFPDRIKR